MKVNNYNVGYRYIAYPNKLKISFFYADVKDEIYYNAVPWPKTSRNTNLDKTRKYGFEVEDKYNIHYNLYAKLNYGFVNTKIKQNSSNPAIVGNEIPGVPKHNIKFSFGYRPNYKTTLLLTHVYRSGTYAMSDFDKNFGKMKSYNSTNMVLNYKVKKFNFFAKINNIFDKRNALFADNGSTMGVYPTNYERTFLFGMSVKF
jgi:iron complex outermembrane receptor protein